jgi:hypothetical protein
MQRQTLRLSPCDRRRYDVECPQPSRSEFRDRLEGQVIFFGISNVGALHVGDFVRHFVGEKLSEPFLVRTCWENAGERSRMQRLYAFVQTRSGDLGESC